MNEALLHTVGRPPSIAVAAAAVSYSSHAHTAIARTIYNTILRFFFSSSLLFSFFLPLFRRLNYFISFHYYQRQHTNLLHCYSAMLNIFTSPRPISMQYERAHENIYRTVRMRNCTISDTNSDQHTVVDSYGWRRKKEKRNIKLAEEYHKI